MKRRFLLQGLALLPAWALLASHGRTALAASAAALTPLAKPASEWRPLLSAAAWRVLFEEDTEAANSSPLNDEHRDGTFVCAACHLPLFDSQHKYDSGTGWPSFTQPLDEAHVGRKRDFKLIWPRIEYHCVRCGGHQGHLFDDGPPPRGERWCNNGLALRFVPRAEPLPELRS
jgi:peptide-methionine (R)-S-oxide reductase